ncbi:MAG: hypothetical protein R2688_08430 [Fimbriimonadaceae bacterium]
MGACLMLRPVERFDERFFLYCEDTELCHRLAQRGKIMYAPEAEFVHELGASSTTTRWESIARYNRGKSFTSNCITENGPAAGACSGTGWELKNAWKSGDSLRS